MKPCTESPTCKRERQREEKSQQDLGEVASGAVVLNLAGEEVPDRQDREFERWK